MAPRKPRLSPEEQKQKDIDRVVYSLKDSPNKNGQWLAEKMRGSNREIPLTHYADMAAEGYAVSFTVETEEWGKQVEKEVFALTPKGMNKALHLADDGIKNEHMWDMELLEFYVESLKDDVNFSTGLSIALGEIDRRTRHLFPDELGEAFEKTIVEHEHGKKFITDKFIGFRKRVKEDSYVDRILELDRPLNSDDYTRFLDELHTMETQIKEQVEGIAAIAAEARMIEHVEKLARGGNVSFSGIGSRVR